MLDLMEEAKLTRMKPVHARVTVSVLEDVRHLRVRAFDAGREHDTTRSAVQHDIDSDVRRVVRFGDFGKHLREFADRPATR